MRVPPKRDSLQWRVKLLMFCSCVHMFFRCSRSCYLHIRHSACSASSCGCVAVCKCNICGYITLWWRLHAFWCNNEAICEILELLEFLKLLFCLNFDFNVACSTWISLHVINQNCWMGQGLSVPCSSLSYCCHCCLSDSFTDRCRNFWRKETASTTAAAHVQFVSAVT